MPNNVGAGHCGGTRTCSIEVVSLSSHFSNIHTFLTAQAGIELKEMLTTRVLRVLSSKVTEDLGKEHRKLDLQRAALTVVWQAAAGGPTTV